MADLPTRAQTVVVGAAIVGVLAAYHLADLGVTHAATVAVRSSVRSQG